VTWDDLDAMWHVNNAVYLDYADQAEKNALTTAGWSIQRCQRENVRVFTDDLTITYLRPALLEDNLKISTWCSNLTHDSALRYYEIHRKSDDQLLVQVTARWCMRNLASEQVLPIPHEMCCD
jgi:YbgC/YbaW family acyl-CoA thioester hydrolase